MCSSLALVARRLCTDVVDPSGVSAFVACRLIALSKFPGVRPIGAGEVVRRIVGKAVLTTLKMEILKLLVHSSFVQDRMEVARLPSTLCAMFL